MKTKIVYKGKVIEVPTFHARRLLDAKRATLPAQHSSKQPEREAEAEETASVVAEETTPTPKQKRAYKRRDMRAED